MGKPWTVAHLTLLTVLAGGCADAPSTVAPPPGSPAEEAHLDRQLRAELASAGFTGRIEATLEARLGRSVAPALAEVGRLLFFDPILSLTGDNSCSGCHGPNVSFNDSQSISIGIGNNGVVGPDRSGPHNRRRAPSLLNAAFYPSLMWDGRFSALSLDPFDNSAGFLLPPPEGTSLSFVDHLLAAQAFTPVVERVEMAGFEFPEDSDAMRAELARRVGGIDAYRNALAEAFPEIDEGGPVRYRHVAAALAEFLFTLVRADAPVDRYARGESGAMTAQQKRGALLFFRRARCADCHRVPDYSNQMFSDFQAHVIGVPQVVPSLGNVLFDGPGADEDYGLERETGDPRDRYRFRTSPLRNVALQPTFMHNGAYLCLEDAVRHHLSAYEMARSFTRSHLPSTLHAPPGPVEPALARLQHLIRSPAALSREEFDAIVEFVRVALTDPDAAPERLASLVPSSVPSGLPVHRFQFERPQVGSCIN